MSYLVLARKYRPATFSEVVGQEHVTRTLGNAFSSGRVHHAFLFCGPRGCGKTTVARIVGKALNCLTTGGKGGEPCGTCDACTSISIGSAVDYQEMDGASNRGIDAIRELTEAVRYQPAVLRKKVYVIDEVHMLTTEAFNALLKTLEEPPPHVTFVLATTEPHKLPNTILSRCQRYDFKLVPASRLAAHLTAIFKREDLAIDPGAVSLLVRESGGSVRDALSLCDQIISYVGAAKITEQHVAEVLGVADRTLTRSLVRALSGGEAGAALAAVESATERGVDEVQLARAIVRYLRDLAVLQVAPDRLELVDASDEERAELAGEAKQIAAGGSQRVTQMFERMLRCCDELGKSLQPRLVLDCALIDVATIEPLVPLGDLIERLGELEGRLAGKGAVRVLPKAGSGGGELKSTTPGASIQPPRAPATRSPEPHKRAEAESRGAIETRGMDARDARGMDARDARGMDARDAREMDARDARGMDARDARGMDARDARGSGASAFASTIEAAPPPPPSELSGTVSTKSGPVSGKSGPVSTKSGPVSMQPSGPVPKVEKTASGSGPQGAQAGDGADKADLKGTLPGVGPDVNDKPRFAVPSSPADALQAWAKVIDYLETQRKISLRGYYEFARVMRWTVSELELGFAADDDSRWAGESAGEKANIDEMRGVLAELGHPVKLTVRMLDATESQTSPARSIIESSRASTSAERQKREVEAREHPITKHVLQTFGAQIKEIKTDV